MGSQIDSVALNQSMALATHVLRANVLVLSQDHRTSLTTTPLSFTSFGNESDPLSMRPSVTSAYHRPESTKSSFIPYNPHEVKRAKGGMPKTCIQCYVRKRPVGSRAGGKKLLLTSAHSAKPEAMLLPAMRVWERQATVRDQFERLLYSIMVGTFLLPTDVIAYRSARSMVR